MFGSTSTRDVDMSGHDELCMYMKLHHKWIVLPMVRATSKSSES